MYFLLLCSILSIFGTSKRIVTTLLHVNWDKTNLFLFVNLVVIVMFWHCKLLAGFDVITPYFHVQKIFANSFLSLLSFSTTESIKTIKDNCFKRLVLNVRLLRKSFVLTGTHRISLF